MLPVLIRGHTETPGGGDRMEVDTRREGLGQPSSSDGWVTIRISIMCRREQCLHSGRR
jgi:hypothetical protein